MEFRRNGQRDERRRRVLRDELLTGDTVQASEATRLKGEAEARVYSDAALASHQPPLTCLLPKRAWTLVLWILVASVSVAGVEVLYSRCFVSLPPESQVSLTALDVTARGSLASWLSSSTLFVGSLVSVLVYSIRRHRIDDYRGRYRVWLWAAAGFLVASLDATTGLHAIIASGLGLATGSSWLGHGPVGALVVLSVMFGPLYARMMFELSASRWATAFLLVAGGLYLIATAYLWPSANVPALVTNTIIGSATLLSAHICIVLAATLLGRHVYLEAQGELPIRRGERKQVESDRHSEAALPPPSEPARHPVAATAPAAKPAPAIASPSGRQVRLDPSHDKTATNLEVQPATKPASKTEPKIEAKPAATKTQAPVFTPDADDDDEDDDLPVNDAQGRPLSKAERRRLRKLERRQKQRE